MTGAYSPEPFPNDFHQSDELSSNPTFDNTKSPLHPIDESDAFYDPFSDLSLFLSKKIKGEIQEAGTAKKWSGKIEANLLAKILPEFKKQFPSYRLGATALKKVWEKVGYYYEKIQHHKGAIGNDGRLNLPLMIRENLKTTVASSSSLNLPPYHLAHQIAVKISECIATIEGRRPDLDQLTKMIWAIQKNTLTNLSPMNAKSPYEEYDKLDKLIVKALLEACAGDTKLSLKSLKQSILETLHLYGTVKPLSKNNQLTSTLSMLLARKLYPTSLITCRLAIPERKSLEAFIDFQIQMSAENKAFEGDTHYFELMQRMMALYPVAKELPQDLTDETLREVIRTTYSSDTPPPIDGALYVFIHAEMHLISEEKSFDDLEKVENQIIAAYRLACNLPELTETLKESFELLIWKKIDEKKEFLADIPENTKHLLDRELANILIDNPNQSFRNIIKGTVQYFKKVQQLPFDEKNNDDFWLKVSKKAEIWALQNEMLCRWIHFDERTPLFAFFKEVRKNAPSHEAFQNELQEKTLKAFPLLRSFEAQLKTRLWILNQYFWYSKLSDGSESSYERFLKAQMKKLKHIYPYLSEEQLEEKLHETSLKMLPFTPFQQFAS